MADCDAAVVDCACDLACDVVVLTSFHGHALATNAICTDACDGVWHEIVRLEDIYQQSEPFTVYGLSLHHVWFARLQRMH